MLKPEILARLEDGVQQTIPGIPRPPRPGEPAEVAPEHPAPRAGSTRHLVHEHPAPRADDSKAFDSRSINTKFSEGGSIDDPRAREGHQPQPAPPHSSLEVNGKTKTQSPSELAKEFCLAGGIPLSHANRTAIAAAIVAESGFAGLPLLEAVRALAGHVDVARNNGQTINRFFFEDAKWRELTKAERMRKASDAYMASYAAIGKNRWGGDGAAPTPAPAPKWDCPDCAGNSGFQMVQRDGRSVAVRCLHNGKQQ